MSIWKNQSSEEQTPWGSVINFSSPFGMHGKIIHIDAGARNSLKYYTEQDQCLYCLSGKVVVTAPKEFEFGDVIHARDGAVFELLPGSLILIQADNPYRIKAMEDSVLVEVLLGKNSGNFVRLDDDYGRTSK